MAEDLAQAIRQAFGGPEYEELFALARKRFEKSGLAPFKTLTLKEADTTICGAIADLFAWPIVPTPPIRIRFDELEAALRRSRAKAGVRQVLEVLGGPLLDRGAERKANQDARERMWAQAHAHPAITANSPLGDWIMELRSTGVLTRAANLAEVSETALLNQAIEGARRLPASGIPLAIFAAQITGDPHALDPGEPLSPLLLRAAHHIAGWSEMPRSAQARRGLWTQVGVLCDPLSSDVLVLGLRPSDNNRLARHLRESADDGEPMRVTQRMLDRSTLTVVPGTEIFVCENPTIVAAAADRLGTRCAPLICMDGAPSTAALDLLGRLANLNARIRFHTDFDWGGLRIGNYLMRRLNTSPWRMTSEDYREALDGDPRHKKLHGRACVALWDDQLRDMMATRSLVVYEEQCIDGLIQDLADGPG